MLIKPPSWEDLHAVSTLLRDSRVFVRPEGLDVDLYDIALMAASNADPQDCATVIIDRNVFSRAFGLLNPRPTGRTAEERVAAAVFAYAGWTGTDYDPVNAVCEGVDGNGAGHGITEAADLAAFQNIDPRAFADIALGRSDQLDRRLLDAERTASMAAGAARLSLDAWSQVEREYLAALKLGSLLRRAGPNPNGAKLFLEYLRWSYEEYCFLWPAFAYGSVALSPNRHGQMFKRINGRDAEAALRGIRNAAWDMWLLRRWSEATDRFARGGPYAFLCTQDRALRSCAQMTMSLTPLSINAKMDIVRTRLVRDWGTSIGERIHRQYVSYCLGAETDERRRGIRDPSRMDRFRRMLTQLETEIRMSA